jgi:NAD(P)-dependent dehydrogenase (short-subunit alcohol dehydrogenase family)
MSEFTGRKVLITGAAGVFGHWILEAFLKAGADIICSDIRVDALRQQVASLGSASGNIKIYEDDLEHKIEGSIIHIGSGAARSLRLNGLPYCISKTALERLAKGFALELAPHGIRVNIVEPGFAPGSEMTTFPTGYVDTVLEGIPLGRSSGPTDAASAVLYLCSNAASFITGTSLSVDGGNSLGKKHGHAVLQSTSD